MACIDIIEAFEVAEQRGVFVIGEIYDRDTIANFITPLGAGIYNPTALTFNRINCGQPFYCPHFVWLRRGLYEYKGHLGDYIGDVYHYQNYFPLPRRAGYYNNGVIEFEDEDVRDFSQYKSKYCQNDNGNDDSSFDETTVELPVTDVGNNDNGCPDLEGFPADHNLNIVQKYDFKQIGSYITNNGDHDVETQPAVQRRSKFKMVYALVSDGKVKYIGKTIQGYSRPLGYLNNDVMHRVQNGIVSQLQEGRTVDIYIRCKGLELAADDINKLPAMNVYSAFEEALIQEFRPPWNASG
jgi:hypothetical protein